jgi:hypothetical protein
MTLLPISVFPNSLTEPFEKTSEQTDDYNCIAWAYGINNKKLWPNALGYDWPRDVPNVPKLESFIILFEKIGFKKCKNGCLKIGYDKIAIYCDIKGEPKHASKQLSDGKWSSKLGRMEDVSHTVFSMSDGFYGNITTYMERRKEKYYLYFLKYFYDSYLKKYFK